ncbi:leucine-rich repeat domain-containing protein [Ruegeria sp. ANG10]|uniref:leucine-rich repeat domain-containing protein n=1 Tax=Ruegeria sp. ANG10 TaxID=3042467 RepID=UPI00345179F4
MNACFSSQAQQSQFDHIGPVTTRCMRKIVLPLVVASAAFAAWQYKLMRTANQQLVVAEQRVTDAISAGTNNLNFSDLVELRKLPVNIGDVPNLKYLNARGTSLSDLTGLEGNATLEHLDVNMTRVSDLKPLQGLPNLKLVYLHDTRVSDVSPIATIPSLERLDIGTTQIDTLRPVTQIESLAWLNLHNSHALDGSREHFAILEGRPFLELSGGSAYRQDYRPGWQYNAMQRLSRLREELGL